MHKPNPYPTLGVTRIDARPDTVGSDWDATASHWKIQLRYGGKSLTTYFSQGSAHTDAPTVQDVLYSLILDSDSGADTFEDFCANCGYEVDSRKAEKTWKACKSINVRLSALLGNRYSAIADYVRWYDEEGYKIAKGQA